MSRDILDLGSWCILQCAGANTLKLFEALIGEGLSAWTPLRWNVARMPVTRARYDKPVPMMPGYVFGDVGHIDQLVRLSAMRRRDFPRFRFLESASGRQFTPLVPDSELASVRERETHLRAVFEGEKRKGDKPPKPGLGVEVKMPEGPFGGLNGVVERTKGRDTVVDIPGLPFQLKVSSLLMLESVAQDGLPLGRAA